MKTFVAASLALVALSLGVSSAQASTVEPVLAKKVAKMTSGRTIVKANGVIYIELQPKEYNLETAQSLYEKHREKFRALLAEDQAEADERDYMIDRSKLAGAYINTGTLPPRTVTAGISLSDFKPVKADQFNPTRDQRLALRGTRSYLILKDQPKSGVYGSATCENFGGRQDVIGLGGRSECYVALRVFRRLN